MACLLLSTSSHIPCIAWQQAGAGCRCHTHIVAVLLTYAGVKKGPCVDTQTCGASVVLLAACFGSAVVVLWQFGGGRGACMVESRWQQQQQLLWREFGRF